MTEPDPRASARHPWLVGGALLIAGEVVALGLSSIPFAGGWGRLLAAGCFAGALLIFAFGMRGEGSVVGRRLLGRAALTALAVWSLVRVLLDPLLFPPAGPLEAAFAMGYSDLLVPFALASIAAAEVGRARVVPHPWRWVPGWVLVGAAVPALIALLVSASDPTGSSAVITVTLSGISGLTHVGGVVLLGVAAIILGTRPAEDRRVVIFRSSD